MASAKIPRPLLNEIVACGNRALIGWSLSRNPLSNSVCFVIGYVFDYSHTFFKKNGKICEPSYFNLASVYS